MAEKPDMVREEYQGASVASGSLSWWVAGHIIGIPVGAVIGGVLGQNERWHQAVVRTWERTKGVGSAVWQKMAKYLPFEERLASHGKMGAYIASGAATGTALFGILAWIVGSGAEVRNAIRGRAQFDRLQDRIEDLSAENAALHAKAESLFEQLKLAQQPKHAVTHVASHEKPALHRESPTKHDSHVAALAAHEPAAEVVRA